MDDKAAHYCVETTTLNSASTGQFDSAEEAMRAVNRSRALRDCTVSICDNADLVLTDLQLAVIVMRERLGKG